MQRLFNKRILLGVTGSVAAYKSAELVRRLRDAGAEVRVVMTEGATEFVTPLTFQALSGHPVHRHLLDAETEAAMGHISLARWADTILVAPASANFLARLAQGRADDLLSAICLAGDVPLAVAPAMNQQMWVDAATQANARALQSRGVLMFGPAAGEQACGEVGPGRMQEPEQLVQQLDEIFESGSLSGRTVVITAGPTREAIDPVRFLSNHSSGKMGYAIAAAAVEAGAKVILISGPTALPVPERVELVQVVSAQQMRDAVMARLVSAEMLIATAAVADYRPVQSATKKLKKDNESLTLELTRNPDILAEAKRHHPQVFCVGFAAETEALVEHARTKLVAKGVEMIAANLVGPSAVEARGVFGNDENALHVVWAEGELSLPLASKARLARDLVALIAERYTNWRPERAPRGKVIKLR